MMDNKATEMFPSSALFPSVTSMHTKIKSDSKREQNEGL